MVFDIKKFVEDLKKSEEAEIVIVATKGVEGQRTKEELHRLIDLLPDENEWAYSIVGATK